MNDAERLARAVLLFYRAAPWSPEDHADWQDLTGHHQISKKVLSDLAHRILDDQKAQSRAHVLHPKWSRRLLPSEQRRAEQTAHRDVLRTLAEGEKSRVAQAGPASEAKGSGRGRSRRGRAGLPAAKRSARSS